MVRTNDLMYEYPDSKPIKFPNIELEAGHALLVIGESGCGKTTLLHLLAGLKQESTGQIYINDNLISEMSASKMDQFRGQNIGIVYQHPHFIESLSLWDNLHISPFSKMKNKAKGVTDRLSINKVLSRYPDQLSAGQKQRASIARAVMNSPKLILADEPTSNLDNKNCSYVIDLLLEESFYNDAALIIVTHDDRLRSEISTCIDLDDVV